MARRKSDPARKRPKRAAKARVAPIRRKKAKKTYNQDRYIIPALRKIWRWYPPRREVKEEALKENGLYVCANCKGEFESIQVDHIDPIGTCKREDGKTDYNRFIDRLLCSKENLACLCEGCHRQKTKEESNVRRAKKNSSKTS